MEGGDADSLLPVLEALSSASRLASPAGLFAFTETLHGLALPGAEPFSPSPTHPSGAGPSEPPQGSPGLLLVHGDVPERAVGHSHLLLREADG